MNPYRRLLPVLVMALSMGAAVANDKSNHIADSLIGPLNLAAAEQRALAAHPQLAAAAARLDAARADAVASGELPDPELRLGLDNLPVDSFALDREAMTMVTVGVSQMFPPPGTLAAERSGAEQMAAASAAAQRDAAARVRLEVRRAWLETFYLDRALSINAENRDFIDLVVEAEVARLAAGTGDQAAVLQARLMRDELLDEQQMLARERDRAAIMLARQVVTDNAQLVLPKDLPPFAPPAEEALLLARLAAHPQAQALEAMWRAAGYQTEVARRAYLPEFGLMAGYGFRQGEMNGDEVPDMASIGVTMSLPIFRDRRQDRRLQARAAEELAARYERDDKLLELRAEVQARYADYARSGERLRLLDEHQLPTAQQAVDTALAAYRSHQAPLAMVIERLHERHVFNLRRWRLATDRALAAVELAYLATTVEETP